MSETETTTESSSRWGELIDMQQQQVVQVVLLGIGVGAAMWLLSVLIRQIILVPIFCGDPTNGACVGATGIAGSVSTVLAALIGLLGLVRLSVFRPLLVALAVAVLLWGLSEVVAGLPWYEGLAWTVLLYALGYAAMAWLVRPRAFLPAIIIVIVVVVLAKWLSSL